MKTPALLFSLFAATFAAGASAHDGGHGRRWEHPHQFDRYDRMERCDYSRPWVHERHHRHHRRVGGAGPCHSIHRGEQLPHYYWHSRYEVRDWHYHDLPRPWRGHFWVRTGNDYVMVDHHTGMVSKVILMRHRR